MTQIQEIQFLQAEIRDIKAIMSDVSEAERMELERELNAHEQELLELEGEY